MRDFNLNCTTVKKHIPKYRDGISLCWTCYANVPAKVAHCYMTFIDNVNIWCNTSDWLWNGIIKYWRWSNRGVLALDKNREQNTEANNWDKRMCVPLN